MESPGTQSEGNEVDTWHDNNVFLGKRASPGFCMAPSDFQNVGNSIGKDEDDSEEG